MRIKYSFVSDLETFTLLRDEWTKLLDRSPICSPFLTWEWLYSWWIDYGQKDPNKTLTIVLGKEGDNIKNILPGYIKREKIGRMKVNIFYFLGSEYESSDYLEIITMDDQNSAHVTEIFDWLISTKRIDIIRLYNVLEDRPILKYLKYFCNERGFDYHFNPHRICPFISIQGDYENYLSSFSKKKRYKIRWYARQLFQKFRAEFSWLHAHDETKIEKSIKQLFELHRKRFQRKNEDTKFQYELRGAFHMKVSKQLLSRGILRLFQLMVDGVPIAMAYGFEYKGELFIYQVGMDPDWKKQSAGQVLYDKIIRYCFNNRLNRLDFMRGGDPYKFRWTDKIRVIVVVHIGVTTAGKLILRTESFISHVKQFIKTRLLRREEWY